METDKKYPQSICEECFDRFINFNQFLQFAVACQKEIEQLVEGRNLQLRLDDYRKLDASRSDIDLYEDVEIVDQQETPIIKNEPPQDIELEIKTEPPNEKISKEEQTFPIADQDEEDINNLCQEIKPDEDQFLSIKFETSDEESEPEEKPRFPVHTTSYLNCDFKVRCTTCGKYVNRSEMGAHLKTHEAIMVKGKDGNYVAPILCKICGTKYKSNKNLRRHMEEVHDDNETVCDICGVVFGNLQKMKRHRSRQHKENPPCCPIEGCQYINPRKTHLHRHLFVSSHHNISLSTKQYLWEEMRKLYGFYELKKKR